jgi:oligoribonuclease NrnB/cAMP/cGMP phosphodiesterase (DHH superfamily)
MTYDYIVSHDSCPDGIAAAMIAASAYPDAEVLFVNYNKPEWCNLPAFERMLFVDMSPPPDRVKEFIAADARVLDHHISQADMVRDMPRGTFDNNACGALLAHREIEGTGSNPRITGALFAHLADVRDRWLKDSPDWSEACAQAAALMFYDREDLLTQARNGMPWLSTEQQTVGRLLEAKCERDAKNAANKAITYTIGACKVAFVNDTAGIISDAAEVLRREGYNLIVGFRLSRDGDHIIARCDYSLRSDEAIDCASFCKRRGGGGHARAAGFNANTNDPIGYFLEAWKP